MKSVVGRTENHYRRANVVPGVVAPREDGLRTRAADGTFEWWYFDGHLEDGSVLTIEFHTKPPYMSPKAPLTPFVLLTLTRADGSRLEKTYVGQPSEFSAATNTCDVRIGANIFRGDQRGYVIHVEIDEVSVDLTLTPQVPPWRPESGFLYFGEHEEHYIAWLPVVARGSVEAALTIDGSAARLSGLGYHDHNWGNIAPRKVLDHWYWGRALLGEYTIVTLMFVVDAEYGGATVPVLLIVKSGEIVAARVGDDGVDVIADDRSIHPDSGVPVDKRVRYSIEQDGATYAVTFRYRKDIFRLDFGAHGAYHRFLGDVELTETSDGQTSTRSGQTVWELLYFGERGHEPTAVMPAGDERPLLFGHQA
ncbi:lipocalin-like domain-containing protein [Nocardia sp. bgisy134]|uniref:lipocalin-like domain-containing protein n=1 Tax=Nocardia sp. bgisy134 TaxID=3413789 RepID=UPI003D728443